MSPVGADGEPDTDELPDGFLQIKEIDAGAWTGKWRLSDGAEGTFRLHFDLLGRSADAAEKPVSEDAMDFQMWSKRLPLGAVTMTRKDLESLVEELKSLLEAPGLPIFRAVIKKQKVNQFADKFLARGDLPKNINEITIELTESSKVPLKKRISVILSNDGSSHLSVEAPSEVWTNGVAQRLSEFMSDFTSFGTGWIRKHGLNLNSIVFLVLLIYLPELELEWRFVAVAAILVAALAMARAYASLPMTRVYLDPERKGVALARQWPTILAGLIASLLGLLVSNLPEMFGALLRWYGS
ncbi:hypothetical protein [Pyruvatibacter sp.]